MNAVKSLKDAFAGLFEDPRHRTRGNPLFIGVVGIVLIISLLAMVAIVPMASYMLRSASWRAGFTNVGNLRVGAPVLIAGVPQGRVEKLHMAGDHVDVEFRVDRSLELGDQTTAKIGLKSILGNSYLDVTPRGIADEDQPRTIPTSRTLPPYTPDNLGADMQKVHEEFDPELMQRMIRTLQEAMPEDTPENRQSIEAGAAALESLAGQSGNFDALLKTATELSVTAVEQKTTIESVRGQSAALMHVLAARRAKLGELIRALETLLSNYSALTRDHGSEIAALMPKYRKVTETLKKNRDNIDAILNQLAPGARNITSASGNGPWFDVTTPTGPIPDNFLCTLGALSGCEYEKQY